MTSEFCRGSPPFFSVSHYCRLPSENVRETAPPRSWTPSRTLRTFERFRPDSRPFGLEHALAYFVTTLETLTVLVGFAATGPTRRICFRRRWARIVARVLFSILIVSHARIIVGFSPFEVFLASDSVELYYRDIV